MFSWATQENPKHQEITLVNLRKFLSSNSEVTTLQSNVDDAIRNIASNTLLNGVIISVSLASGSNQIAHSLGKVPQGYWVIRKSAAADIYDTSITLNILTLNSSAACDVKLLVF